MGSLKLLQIARDDPPGIRAELLAGLRAPTAAIAPKYLYDALGSRLFCAITELPEYYPTRTEAAIFATELPAIAATLGPVHTLVDLGAGSCEKAQRLFGALAVERYVAVDISAGYLRVVLEDMHRHYPALDILGVGLDFSARLELPAEVGEGPRTLFYPGSSIGNFTPHQALDFLRQAHATSQGGALLIGVDLVKPARVLEPAYDDPLGVTAAFNRNMLLHLTRLAGTDFDIRQWRHVAFFNTTESRIEMHLEATADNVVRWAEGDRHFARGERIHTENSYKWRVDDFSGMLRAAGFSRLSHWTDPHGWFAVFAAFV